MLNTAHAGTLAGLAALRTKCSHMCHFIRQGATRRRMQLHMCQIFIGKRRGGYTAHMCQFFIEERAGTYVSNFHRGATRRMQFHMCQFIHRGAARRRM